MIMLASMIFTGGIVITDFRSFHSRKTHLDNDIQAYAAIENRYLVRRIPFVLYYVTTRPDRGIEVIVQDESQCSGSLTINRIEVIYESARESVVLQGAPWKAVFETRNSAPHLKERTWKEANVSVDLGQHIDFESFILVLDGHIDGKDLKKRSIHMEIVIPCRKDFRIQTRWKCISEGWYIH